MDLGDIREYLSYDPEIGVFRWIKRLGTSHFVGEIAGTVRADGRRIITFRNRKYRAHRLAWWFMHGEMPSEIDHIHGVAGGDGIANLRLATRSQNQANVDPPRTNKSGYKGVCFDEHEQSWKATIGIAGRTKNLGRFKTPEEAARAYDIAAVELFGEFARPNFRESDLT